MPPEFKVLTGIVAAPSANTAIVIPSFSPSTTARTLTVKFPSITGTASYSDAVVAIPFYATDFDARGLPVIDPHTGAPSTVPQENTTVNGFYFDSAKNLSRPITTAVDAANITLKSLIVTVQAADAIDVGNNGYSALDTIQWTSSIQISDYFSFSNLSLENTYSDGQMYDTGYTPYLSGNGVGKLNFSDSLNLDVDPATANISFDISNLLPPAKVQLNGQLLTLPGTLVGPVTGLQVAYRTVVKPLFSNPPSTVAEGDYVGSKSVSQSSSHAALNQF